MKSLLLRVILVITPCLTLQSCMVMSMVFDPAVRAAFIIPEDITPMSAVKEDPKQFSGEHIAVTGTVTAIASEVFVLEDFLTVKNYRSHEPYELKPGDEVAVEGKVVAPPFSKGRLEMRYARPFMPRTDRYQPTYGANKPAISSPIPSRVD